MLVVHSKHILTRIPSWVKWQNNGRFLLLGLVWDGSIGNCTTNTVTNGRLQRIQSNNNIHLTWKNVHD